MGNIKEMLDRIIEDGVLTSDEHDQFIEAVHADGEIDEEEGKQISRLFQLIQEGKLKVVDSEREASEIRKKADTEKKLKDWE